MARKVTFKNATKNDNTQELMVNGLWAVKGENAKFEMTRKTDFSSLDEAVYLSLRERIILLVGALAMDASEKKTLKVRSP